MTPEIYRVAVVGARRQRQGTGEYVAREFARCGCEVRAIVGTTKATTELARSTLAERYGIKCTGFLSLQELLEKESVHIVAVCSPADSHLPQLELAVAAGCHVFCEKPLWWTADLAQLPDAQAEIRRRAERLIDRCEAQGRYLALNTQWPFTLKAFRQLHPRAYGENRPVEHFAMWLSPASRGASMVVDAGPHLLSMLQALAGPGTLKDIRANVQEVAGSEPFSDLSLTCVYKHERGEIQVEFKLSHWPRVPRPAGYRVNGFGAERHVEMPAYLLSFVSSGKRVPVRDPLAACVEGFVDSMRAGNQPNRNQLVDGMTQLHELVVATKLTE